LVEKTVVKNKYTQPVKIAERFIETNKKVFDMANKGKNCARLNSDHLKALF